MSASTVVVPPITVEQFFHFEAPPGYRAELIDGEIILSPDPKPLHQTIVSNIYKALNSVVDLEQYVINMRTNFNLKEIHYAPSPDVFVVDRQEWLQSIVENRYPIGAPILAVEVLSESNRERQVERKKRAYFRKGAKQLWIVDPRSLSGHIVNDIRPDGSVRIREPGQTVQLAPPLSGELDIVGFFKL